MNNFESEIRKLACGYVSKLAGQVKPDSLKLRYVLEHFVCLTKVCLARQVNGFLLLLFNFIIRYLLCDNNI